MPALPRRRIALLLVLLLALLGAGCHWIFPFQSGTSDGDTGAGPPTADRAPAPGDTAAAADIDWSAGFVVHAATVVNTHTQDHQFEPRLARLESGDLVVVWQGEGQDDDRFPTGSGASGYGGLGVFGRRFDAAGAPIGPEIQINVRTAAGQFQPALAPLGEDRFVTAWLSQSSDSAGDAVRANRRDGGGALIDEEFQVNTSEPSDQLNPAVAALEDGTFVVAWRSRGGLDGDSGIFAKAFSAAGSRVSAELPVNTYTAGDQTHPAVAALGGSRYLVAWASDGQDGDGSGVYGQIFFQPDQRDGEEFQIHTTAAGDQQRPDVAAVADGGFVVAWEHEAADGERAIQMQRFDGGGEKLGGEVKVSRSPIGARPAWVNGEVPDVCVFPGGHFIVAWGGYGQDGDGDGVRGQLFDGQGSRVGQELLLSDDPLRVTDLWTAFRYHVDLVCPRDGELAAVWASSRGDAVDLDVTLALLALK
jgi:hypothetical protein